MKKNIQKFSQLLISCAFSDRWPHWENIFHNYVRVQRGKHQVKEIPSGIAQ